MSKVGYTLGLKRSKSLGHLQSPFLGRKGEQDGRSDLGYLTGPSVLRNTLMNSSSSCTAVFGPGDFRKEENYGVKRNLLDGLLTYSSSSAKQVPSSLSFPFTNCITKDRYFQAQGGHPNLESPRSGNPGHVHVSWPVAGGFPGWQCDCPRSLTVATPVESTSPVITDWLLLSAALTRAPPRNCLAFVARGSIHLSFQFSNSPPSSLSRSPLSSRCLSLAPHPSPAVRNPLPVGTAPHRTGPATTYTRQRNNHIITEQHPYTKRLFTTTLPHLQLQLLQISQILCGPRDAITIVIHDALTSTPTRHLHFHSSLPFVMADQCIICLETFEQAVPASPARPASPKSTTAQPQLGLSELPIRPKSPERAGTTNNTSSAPDSHDNVAEIPICGHILHDSCLREWTEKANSCPICRQLFYLVRVYDKVGGSLLFTREVEDKKQVAEFDFQAWAEENPDQDDLQTPCPVCRRSDNEDILLLCDGCDTPYHTHCIGLDEVPEGNWFCMECVDAMGEDIANHEQSPMYLLFEREAQPRQRRQTYHPRTQARMRQARARQRADNWQGAWGRITGQVWNALGVDLDYLDQEDSHDFERLRRSQQRRAEEAREQERRRQQRLNIASRLGAREVFENNLPHGRTLAPAVREPTAESRDVMRAWSALEKSREMDSGSSRKRKSRSSTPDQQAAQQEPGRPLKRPRTRRLPAQNGESSSTAEATASSSTQPPQPIPAPIAARPRPTTESAPSFLTSLLKEVEMSTPSDERSLQALFGPIPGANDVSSPVGSPSPSGYSSPRASSTTPPPNESARRGSPLMLLSSHIEPIYPPANFSPTRSISPNKNTASENRSSPENSDSEQRRSRGNGTTELRQPRPRRGRPVILATSQESSPTRAGHTHELPLEMKESISSIVRSALRPHWRSKQLTSDQYASINRAVSQKLYKEVRDPATVTESARQNWEKLATNEVARAVAELKV
ncbi:hypothetical protein B0H66DRAFT_536784 [Apodospora peruviana]|uniref:PHD and RING finger domain-containing protein n=1 Tax=Apodospora peruviana TaxID=516989 RepID=A0AAE0LZP3_9PEZI|nr:hypothetical protein B0H66DRAFT_536784 [Apodospora peruviana]